MNSVPAIKIHEIRLSCIWVETFLDLLRDPAPQTDLAFLGRDLTYMQYVDALSTGRVGPQGLRLPWLEEKPCFWTSYLEQPNLEKVGGTKAWKSLMPLLGEVPVRVKAAWLPKLSRFDLKAYFYPHGLAFIFNAFCLGDFTLSEALQTAFQIHRTGNLEVEWQAGGSQSLNLQSLGHKVLDILRAKALGISATPRVISEPFTVVTVVRGEGVDPIQPIPQGGVIHRALEALTTWRPDYETVNLPDLDDKVCLPIRESAAGHVLYYHNRGRAVWFPALFTKKDQRLHSLSCFHRNLVAASQQVESLGGLAVATADDLRQSRPLMAPQHFCAGKAVDILGRFYGKAFKTYRSASPRYQMEQNGLVDPVNAVRAFFNRPPLS
jgi:hypothetical protein